MTNFKGFGDKLSKISPIRLFRGAEKKTDTVEVNAVVDRMMQKKNIRTIFGGNIEFAKENYSAEGQSFIQRFTKNFPAYIKEMSLTDYNDVLMMYKSSTPKNVEARLEIMDKFRNNYTKGSGRSQIHSMKVLFGRMDRDKHTANFINKVLGDDIKVKTIDELNKIIDVVPPKKAEIFHRNISRIVRLTNPAERESALAQHCENPVFDNPRIMHRGELSTQQYRKLNYVEKIGKFIENKVNIRKYKRLLKTEPGIESRSAFAKISIPSIEQTLSEGMAPQYGQINLVKTLKQSPKAKKLKVQSDVNNVIREKLGQKTFETQKDRYSQKATLIKLNLLPDIFESISATRKSQRISGKTPNVKNSDAIKLYEKIQGKNRKLVRYMLNKTDENNNRIFSINDIVTVIDNAENKIAVEKKLNPEFRAKDSKAYYDNIYDSMVEKYGKPKRTRK